MIESVMLIVFGFCAATLLALMTLPFVTRRSARLAAERLRDVVPLTVDEIAAERDGVRAAAAVEQRRLEQKASLAEVALAARAADYGRRTSELATLQETHAGEMAAKAALALELEQIQARCTDIAGARDELQRQLTAMEASLRDAEITARVLTAKRNEFESLAEERRGAIAGLETRCAGLDMRREDLEADLARLRADRDTLRTALTDMTVDRDLSRTENQLVATQRAILQDDLTEANRRAETLRARLDAKSDALAQAEHEMMIEKADRKNAQAALEDLKRRFESLEARLIAHGSGDSEPGRIEALRMAVASVADQALDTLGRTDEPKRDTAAGDSQAELEAADRARS